jgi:hypothetical protein
VAEIRTVTTLRREREEISGLFEIMKSGSTKPAPI